MQTNTIVYLSAKDCPYTYKGVNLFGVRKAELLKVAKSLKVDTDIPKNDMLKTIIKKLDMLDSEKELSDMITLNIDVPEQTGLQISSTLNFK